MTCLGAERHVHVDINPETWSEVSPASSSTVAQRDNVVYWKTKGKINNDLQLRSFIVVSFCEEAPLHCSRESCR